MHKKLIIFTDLSKGQDHQQNINYIFQFKQFVRVLVYNSALYLEVQELKANKGISVFFGWRSAILSLFILRSCLLITALFVSGKLCCQCNHF